MMVQETMTFGDAIASLEALFHEFCFRSGGGDGAVIEGAFRALEYLRRMQEMNIHSALRSCEQEAISTGSAQPVLSVLELLKFELLALSLEDILLFSPDGSKAREVAKEMLTHLQKVRDLRDSLLEVE